KNVKSIGSQAFMNCKQIKEVILPESLTELQGYAFNGCSSLETIHIPSNPALKSISQAFPGCTSLKSVTIPPNITDIAWAFVDCGTIDEMIFSDGNSELYVGESAGASIFGSTIIKKLHLGRNCFSGDLAARFRNQGIETLVIGDSVTAINGWMFEENPIKSLSIGKNVKSIGSQAFMNCKQINEIKTYAEEPPVCEGEGVFSQEAYDSALLLVPTGTSQAYASAEVWKLFKHKGQSTCAVTFEYDEEQCDVNATTEGFAGTVDYGASLSFTAMPQEGFKVESVTASGEYLFLTPGENHEWRLDSIQSDITVKVASDEIRYTILARIDSKAGHITVNGEKTDSTTIVYGMGATIGIVLNEGFKVDSIGMNDTDATAMFADGKLTIDRMIEDITLSVLTSLKTFTFTTDYDATYGSVSVGGNTATAQQYTYGSRPEIEIMPDEGFCPSTVMLNGEDITSLFEGNRYQTDSIKSDMTLSVTFEARTVTLSILGLQGGRVAPVYNYGASARIRLLPDDEWTVNAVTFNGTLADNAEIADGLFVTPALTDDSDLSVTFVKKDPTSIDDVEASGIRVYGNDLKIIILDAPQEAQAVVVDPAGRTLYAGTDRTIPVAHPGIYMVSICNRTFKLML
ncbi:leucine-rich repeat domain-containing protein, partial [uncultured Muribaculum sp.]